VSSNHKAPLAAFVVVAIACVVVLATNSMRSYARDAWRDFAAPVVSGLALLPSEHHEPAKQAAAPATIAAADDVVVPAGPALKVATPHHRHAAHHVRHAADAAPSTTRHVGSASQAPVATAAATPVSHDLPETPSPGEHRGWGQGEHTGWAYSPHGQSISTYTHTATSGHANGWQAAGVQYGKSWQHSAWAPTSGKASMATHGPSWKTSDAHPSSGFGHGAVASMVETAAFGHGSSHGSSHGDTGPDYATHGDAGHDGAAHGYGYGHGRGH